MMFELHFLREEDNFADIGANIGSYTVLASGHVGAKTICIEPVPATFSHLTNNIAINHIENKVTALNIALGSKEGTIKFTSSFDTMNHVAVETDLNIIEVPVKTVDEILKDREMPVLFKIDVEGFETEVMNGASTTLKRDELKAIIIELNGSGTRYGYDERKIHDELLNLNFRPYQYFPFERKLVPLTTFGTHNTIYIRDLDFVNARVTTAPAISILGQKI